jgi:hypothetical protein
MADEQNDQTEQLDNNVFFPPSTSSPRQPGLTPSAAEQGRERGDGEDAANSLEIEPDSYAIEPDPKRNTMQGTEYKL